MKKIKPQTDISKLNVVSMSSLEIAELTGKEHKDVLETIDKMFMDLEIQSAEFSAHYKDARNRKQRMYMLNKHYTLVLVSGYSTILRDKIINRLQFLEDLYQKSKKAREYARLKSPEMQEALRLKRESEGKKTEGHHYSNEENLIYLVVFGMKAHKFKEINNLGENDSIRDYLREHNPIALNAIVELLNKNRHYLDDMVEYDERKELLTRYFNRRYKGQMLLD